jgi:putative transposase
MTDEQWALVAPLLPPAKPGGRHRTTDLRAVVDGCQYRTKTGCQWRMLPKDFPPWSTVHTYHRAWRRDGTWKHVHDTLVPQVREQAGREPTPETGYLDSQSVKAAGAGGPVGFDAGKKVNGRKRHVVVDSLGLIWALFVTAANVSDPQGAEDALALLPLERMPRLKRIWADTAYGAKRVWAAVAFWGQYVLGIVRRPQGLKGWVLLPKRWVVERTFAWLLRYRLLNREYERRTDSSEADIYLAMTHRMLQRLRPRPRRHSERFRYREAG